MLSMVLITRYVPLCHLWHVIMTLWILLSSKQTNISLPRQFRRALLFRSALSPISDSSCLLTHCGQEKAGASTQLVCDGLGKTLSKCIPYIEHQYTTSRSGLSEWATNETNHFDTCHGHTLTRRMYYGKCHMLALIRSGQTAIDKIPTQLATVKNDELPTAVRIAK